MHTHPHNYIQSKREEIRVVFIYTEFRQITTNCEIRVLIASHAKVGRHEINFLQVIH